MRYASVAAIPAALTAAARVYDSVDSSVWVTPPSRVLDATAAHRLSSVSDLLIANGGSSAPIADTGIASKISRSGRLFNVDILSTDAQVSGVWRSQIDCNKVWRPQYETRYLWSVGVRLNTWNTVVSGARVLIAQLKDLPDTALGEVGRQPALSLVVDRGEVQLHVRYDAAQVTAGGTLPVSETISAPITSDAWMTLSVEFVLTRGTGGYAILYKDGAQVGRTSGPVGLNDFAGPYLAFGTYCFEGFGGLGGRSATFRGCLIDTAATLSENEAALAAVVA